MGQVICLFISWFVLVLHIFTLKAHQPYKFDPVFEDRLLWTQLLQLLAIFNKNIAGNPSEDGASHSAVLLQRRKHYDFGSENGLKHQMALNNKDNDDWLVDVAEQFHLGSSRINLCGGKLKKCGRLWGCLSSHKDITLVN